MAPASMPGARPGFQPNRAGGAGAGGAIRSPENPVTPCALRHPTGPRTGPHRAGRVRSVTRDSHPPLEYTDMKNEPKARPDSNEPTTSSAARRLATRLGWTALAVSLTSAAVAYTDDGGDRGISPKQLRQLIDRQVGGIEKLMVPAENANLP